MSQQILNVVSTVFALCAFVFFIVGCIGYSGMDDNIKNTAWITVDDNGFKAWFGLLKYRFSAGVTKDTVALKDCNASFCNVCERNGESAFGLLVVSTIFAAVSTALGGVLSASPQAMIQITNLIVSFISASFAIIGFGLFMGECFKKIDDSGDFDLEWGPGSILTCLGLIMMWLVVVMQLLAMIMSPKA